MESAATVRAEMMLEVLKWCSHRIKRDVRVRCVDVCMYVYTSIS